MTCGSHGHLPSESRTCLQLNQPAPPLERRRVVVPDRAQSCRAEGILRQQLKRLENCAQRDDGRLTVNTELIVLGIIGLVLFILAIVILNFGLVWVKAYVSGVPVAFIELIALQLRMIPVRTIVDARITLIKSGFNVSVDDLSTHHLAGGDVIMVTEGLLKAKEKNIDLSFDQACALDLKAAKELDKLRKKSKLKFVDELSSEEEVEIMEPTANVRDYEVNDYVSLKNGGEGNIIKIIYVVMDDSEEVLFLKKCDLGNHTQRDI